MGLVYIYRETVVGHLNFHRLMLRAGVGLSSTGGEGARLAMVDTSLMAAPRLQPRRGGMSLNSDQQPCFPRFHLSQLPPKSTSTQIKTTHYLAGNAGQLRRLEA